MTPINFSGAGLEYEGSSKSKGLKSNVEIPTYKAKVLSYRYNGNSKNELIWMFRNHWCLFSIGQHQKQRDISYHVLNCHFRSVKFLLVRVLAGGPEMSQSIFHHSCLVFRRIQRILYPA